MRRLFKGFAWMLSLVCIWTVIIFPAWGDTALKAPAAATTTAVNLFAQNCAGCHVGGGNIVRRRKTLKQRSLQRNGIDSVAAIAQLITNGKGLMSAYGDRLTPEETELLASYVWQQAQNNWQ